MWVRASSVYCAYVLKETCLAKSILYNEAYEYNFNLFHLDALFFYGPIFHLVSK